MTVYPEELTNRKYMHARMDANDALTKMGVNVGHQDYGLLKRLLGRRLPCNLNSTFTEEDYKTCLMLAGPHGYTIFKMLCLKHGLTELVDTCADS